MAHSVESRSNNAANALRDALDKAERLVVTIDEASAERFLLLLDEIQQALDSMSHTGFDLRPEEVRWQSLLNRLASKPGPIAAAVRKAGGYTQLRAQHPPAENFWWQLDKVVAERRRKDLQRIGTTVGTIVAVIALILWGVNTFFPPDPETLLLVETTNDIDTLVFEGRWEEALAVVEQGLTQLPDAPELLIWESVLAEQVGDMERSQQSAARAQEILADNPQGYWITLGNTRLQVGNLDGAEAAANSMIAIDENDAQAYFLLGGIAELRGERAVALEMFDKTFVLAEEDNPQLAVIAKVRLGQLLQQVAPPAPETPTPTI